MISGLSLVVNVAGYIAALAITVVSGLYTARQRTTAYQLIRDFLVLVYCAIIVLMLVDLARLLTESATLLSVYPLFSFGIGFLEAILLLTAAVGAYLRPNGSSYRLLVKDVRSHPRHLLMFLLFIGGTIAAEAYLAVLKPYQVATAADFAGGTVGAVAYSVSFSIGIGILFLFFLAYPVGLLAIGATRVRNPQMKRAQFGLAVGFAGSTSIYLASSVSLLNYGLDLTAVTYIILSVFFGVIARNFRRAAVFAGFVLPVAAEGSSELQASRTRARDGVPVKLVGGELSLVEVDTSARYEEKLNDLVWDFRAERRGVFVVSLKGSRLHGYFSKVVGVKLFTMSESATYISPSPVSSDEVNIPFFDRAVMLDVLDRTLGSATEPTAVIFDSLSDMLFKWGFQQSYRFLKEAGEIVSGKDAVALFILFDGAHGEKDVTAIRGVFPSQLKAGSDGIDIVR